MAFKLGNAGLYLIKQFESCKLEAYKCLPTEKYFTIGWGHSGADVTEGMTITQKEADDLLISDLKKFVKYTNTYTTGMDITQNQFDALVSFCYNCGPGTLKKLVKGRTLEQIAESFSSYNKSGGKVMAGLVKRRAAEKELFIKDMREENKGGTVMAVIIGHASIDENKNVKGGVAGDQTGKEVCTRSWYSKPWTCVIRPKDSDVAEKIATAMEQACANNRIGYDQNQRTTLYVQAKVNGWDLSKVATNCECDCSSLVSVCVNAAGISASKDMYTGNEKSVLSATGQFEILTSSEYTSSNKKLKRGDILLGKGHTAIVLSDGVEVENIVEVINTAYIGKGIGKAVAKSDMKIRSGAGTNYSVLGTIKKGTSLEVLEVLSNGWYKIVWEKASCGYAYTSNRNNQYYTFIPNQDTYADIEIDKAKSKDLALAGTYKVTAQSGLKMRSGAGTGKDVISVLKNGTEVKCYGFYTVINGVKWLLVAVNNNTGFCSSEYLKKA